MRSLSAGQRKTNQRRMQSCDQGLTNQRPGAVYWHDILSQYYSVTAETLSHSASTTQRSNTIKTFRAPNKLFKFTIRDHNKTLQIQV